MAVASQDMDPTQLRLETRLKGMGLHTRAMANGKSVLVTLDLGPAPFESKAGPVHPAHVLFATVGATQIKCLRPRALFGLPLIDIRTCNDAASIESAIRQAWLAHTHILDGTRETLTRLGIDLAPNNGSSALGFSLPGESPTALVRMREPRKAILPSTGPLSGIPLERPEDRIIDVRDCLDSASELEGRLAQHISELVEAGQKRTASSRMRPGVDSRSMSQGPSGRQTIAEPRIVKTYHPKVLLVGTQLSADAHLREELERQGYQIAISHSESEALTRLASMSPELILSQYKLGRSDGASFVAAMSTLAGIERIPVVLIDDSHHPSRRDAARAVGAAAYTTEPREMDRFVSRIGQLVREPGNRRFKRYAGRLSAKMPGLGESCIVTEVGRGGVFVTTQAPIDSQTAMRCQIALPEIGHNLDFDGEVLYRAELQGGTRQGLGIRFFEMSTEDERALIQYLGWLERQV